MKLDDLKLKEIEYLPAELMKTFADSYSASFPELQKDKSSLISFLNHKFSPLEGSGNHNISALVTSDGIVASGYGIVRNLYSQSDKYINVGLVCDVFTKSDFRNMGLFKRVSQLAIRREELTETHFLIGFPIRPEVMPGHLSVGWRYIFDMPLWWGLPRFGFLKDVQKNPALSSSMFTTPNKNKCIAINISNDFLKWRFKFHNVDYYLISVPNTCDFAIVRKATLRKLPFTCIIFMKSSSADNTRALIRKIRILSLRLGTVGVLGAWNESYGDELFLTNSGITKSSKAQKVIVRELNGFICPSDESEYRLSWIDSDTL